MADTEEVCNLAEYFEELYWGEAELNISARNILDDYLDYRGIDSLEAENLVRHQPEGLNREEFRDNFQEFLAEKLDSNHNGSISNPDIEENCLETDVRLGFGYINYKGFSRPDHPVFMTAKMEFEDFEEDEESVFVRYYREDEGLEAFRKLLEQEDGKRQAEFITRNNIRDGSENALKAYEVIAEERPEMAEDILAGIVNKEVRASMEEILENQDD